MSKVETGAGEQRQALLTFDADGDPRVNDWAAGTPHFHLTMTLKGEAADKFTESANYTLTFAEDE